MVGAKRSLPRKYLQDSFQNLCYVRAGIVVKKDDFVLSMWPFLSDSLVYSIKLYYIHILVGCRILFKHFPVYKKLPIVLKTNHICFWDRDRAWGYPLKIPIFISVLY